MAINTSESGSQKVTITLPKLVVQRLHELVPARQRSRFIAETLSERLILEEQRLALEESAGAWADESHPELRDDEAIDRWLADLRRTWVTPQQPGAEA